MDGGGGCRPTGTCLNGRDAPGGTADTAASKSKRKRAPWRSASASPVQLLERSRSAKVGQGRMAVYFLPVVRPASTSAHTLSIPWLELTELQMPASDNNSLLRGSQVAQSEEAQSEEAQSQEAQQAS